MQAAGQLERAVALCRAALQVRTREHSPHKFRDTMFALGRALEKLERWTEAHVAYTIVREVQRDVLAATPIGTHYHAIAFRANMDIYVHDAYTMLAQQVPDSEIALVLEEGRAQSMRMQLNIEETSQQVLISPKAEKRRNAFLEAQRSCYKAQEAVTSALIRGSTLKEIEILFKGLRESHALASHALEAIRAIDAPDFLAEAPTMEQLERAIGGPHHALVYLVAGASSGFALIGRRTEQGTQFEHLILPAFTQDAVAHLSESYAQRVEQAGEREQELLLINGGLIQAQTGAAFANLASWGENMQEALNLLSSGGFAAAAKRVIEHWSTTVRMQPYTPLLQKPFAQMSEEERAIIAGDFHRFLLSYEVQRSLVELAGRGVGDLAAKMLEQGTRHLALIPYGTLGIFPFSAIPLNSTETSTVQTLGDLFDLSIVPSARALDAARVHVGHEDRKSRSILAVGNPATSTRSSLPWANVEVNTLQRIAKHSQLPVQVLVGKEATRESVLAALPGAWYVHFAMHGQYVVENPRDSRLLLAHGTALTLAECLDGKFPFGRVELLVLSACETSLMEVRQAADEVLSLAASFLQAGCANVIASLWPVSDRATYLLMSYFMHAYLDSHQNRSPARCLAEAQYWLREKATNAVLRTYSPSEQVLLPPSAVQPASTPARTGSRVASFPSSRTSEVSGIRSLRYSYSTALQMIREQAESGAPDERPYADPYYWAAFTLAGRNE